MAGPMYGQSQFKEYGAEPGKYLLQGMQVGSQIRKNEADTEMMNMYKNQLMAESQQKMATQQREDDPARIENLLLGLSAITTEDKNEFNHAKEVIYNSLPDEEKQRLGDHKKWSRVDVGRYLGKQTTGKDIGPLLQFLSKDTANKTKADIADKKLSRKDPKVVQAWMPYQYQMKEDVPENVRKGLYAKYLERIDKGDTPEQGIMYVDDLLTANKSDWEQQESEIQDYNKENAGINVFGKQWTGKGAKKMPMRPSISDTEAAMGGGGRGGGMGEGNDPIIQTGTNAQGQRVGKTKSGKIVPLGK